LNLDQSSVRGTEIHRLKNQTKLTHLNLIGTNVDDKALEHIGSFSQLEWLDLSFTKVTDAGMKDLSQLQHLQELYLG
jgi:internalin A